MTSISLYFTVIDQSHLQIGKSIESSLWSVLVVTDIHELDTFTKPGSLFGACAVSNFGENFWSAYIPLLVGELSTLYQHHKESLAHSRMPLLVMMFLILTKALLAMRIDSGRIFSETLRQIVRDGTCSPNDIKWIDLPTTYTCARSCLLCGDQLWVQKVSQILSNGQCAVGLTIVNILFVRFAPVCSVRLRMHRKLVSLLSYQGPLPVLFISLVSIDTLTTYEASDLRMMTIQDILLFAQYSMCTSGFEAEKGVQRRDDC